MLFGRNNRKFISIIEVVNETRVAENVRIALKYTKTILFPLPSSAHFAFVSVFEEGSGNGIESRTKLTFLLI